MGKKILVVDDEPTIRQFFELVLSEAGYEVATASDGASALKAARQTLFDLVFLDILLPDSHGSDILAQLKQLTPCPIVCVVTAMSSSDYERIEDYTKLIKLGVKDKFLRKPLGADEVLKAAKELLAEDVRPGGAS